MSYTSVGDHVCGCFYTTARQRGLLERHYLPVVELKSHTTLTPVCFTTRLRQTFRNPHADSLKKIRYTFPLYDGVAVNGYTISYANKIIEGVVKQKDEAKKTYDAAVQRGETAGLLEGLPAGIFGITLGNVPARTDVLVDVTYCGELKHDAAIDGLRYTLPTKIAPRYGNYPGTLLDVNTTTNAGISITVDADMAGSGIRKIQSPSHPIAVSMGALSTASAGPQMHYVASQASATLTLGTTELEDDFVLQLLIDDINKPQAILETHPSLPNQRAIMATLVPSFRLESAHPEIVFIADQSGSMSGSKNKALVSAIMVFLKSLPFDVRFNICAFGNHFKYLWPTSQAYNETNIEAALSFVGSFSASYGGTMILEPMIEAFKNRLKDMPLEIMLLTDGEIWAEHELFNFINKQIHDEKVDARVFALGIGSDVSHSLVEGVARAGNGFSQFVTQNEETDQKVIRMLKAALYAHTQNYSLEIHQQESTEFTSDSDDFEIVEKVNDCLNIKETGSSAEQAKTAKSFFDPSEKLDEPTTTTDRYAHLPNVETPKLLQAPTTIPPFFPFNRTTVYLLLGPDTAQKGVHAITVRATSAEGPLELTVPVHSLRDRSTTIHQLAARKAIQDLDDGCGWLHSATIGPKGVLAKEAYVSRFDEIVERETVRLGERFQVASKHTSFVAVEKNGDKTTESSGEPEQDVPKNALSMQSFYTAKVGATLPPPTLLSRGNALPPPAPNSGPDGSHFDLVSQNDLLGLDEQAMAFESMLAPQAAPRYASVHAPMARKRAVAPSSSANNAPVNPASSTQATTRAGIMHKVVNMQTFSGAWAWRFELFETIGLAEEDIKLPGKDKDANATALAVAFLETRLSDKREAWDMVAAKSRSWLQNRLGLDAEGVDKLIRAAAAYF